jgi:predicted NAD/FAD-dependent oxidoreductase
VVRHVAVIGAGVAGLVAADHLRRRGLAVTVFEAQPWVGGRTHTLDLGDGLLLDSGAAWLTSFYPTALSYTAGLTAQPRQVATLPRLRPWDGDGFGPATAAPFDPRTIATTPLLTTGEKRRFAWLAARTLGRRSRVRVGPPTARLAGDDLIDADALVRASCGDGIADHLLRPAFETMMFCRLDQLSWAFVACWLRAALTARYSVPSAGMDAPWRRLARTLDVRTGHRVAAVRAIAGGVEVAPFGRFSAAVVAVPAPVAARLVDPHDRARPAWIDQVEYATHVFGYAARRSTPGDAGSSDVHPSGPGRFPVGSVQLLSDVTSHVPRGWQAAMVSASGRQSALLLDQSDDAVLTRLWADGRFLEPRLFPLTTALVTRLVRWQHAVPVVAPGLLTRLSGWQQQGPIVYAGDWTWYPCVEGAAVSGVRAARAIG